MSMEQAHGVHTARRHEGRTGLFAWIPPYAISFLFPHSLSRTKLVPSIQNSNLYDHEIENFRREDGSSPLCALRPQALIDIVFSAALTTQGSRRTAEARIRNLSATA